MSWILIWSIDHTKTKQKIFDCWISGICWWTKLKEVNKTYSSFSMGIRRIWIMKIVMAESQTSEDNQNEASKRATSSFISGYQDYELIWSKHNPKRTVLYSLCTYEVYIWGKQNNFKYSTTEEKKTIWLSNQSSTGCVECYEVNKSTLTQVNHFDLIIPLYIKTNKKENKSCLPS